MNMPECIDVGGRTVPLIVRSREKTRHLRLRLNHKNQVVVSVPWHYSNREVLSFIVRQHDWLEQQVARIPEASNMSDWLREHPFLSASGECFTVRVEPVDCLRASYQFEPNRAELVLCVPKNREDFETALLKLLRTFSKDALACRLNYYARRLNLKFERLTVRDQTSRWGSCSSKRCISLNWRLILIEPELQDHVILHELAHLTEMNHSKRFWDLLDSYDPLRPYHDPGLKAVTGTIMRVGRC
ncbi:MAG: putative metal-dependent hydrolase [Lentimonas sp.]|jgi:predicted metal-dependent hydrolase